MDFNTSLTQTIEDSFTQYAGAVIQSRALVDVRDCVKPSARQIYWCLYTDKFIDYDGYLATSNDNSLIRPYVEGISRAVLDDCPDTYRLIAQDDETVQFTLISHYDNNWNTQGIMDVFTIEYPICMVNTESGWRMDEFHTTLHG